MVPDQTALTALLMEMPLKQLFKGYHFCTQKCIPARSLCKRDSKCLKIDFLENEITCTI